MDVLLIKGLCVLLLQLFMLGIDSGHAQQSVTCDAGTAYIGESSNVTCYYHKDIGKNKLSVNVAMVPTTPEKENEERDVIQCSWKQQVDTPQCLVADFYKFNYEVTDRLTVEIPVTSPRFAGVYTCRIVPPDDATVSTCTLVVKEKVAEISRSSILSSRQGSPTVSDWEKGALTTIITLQIVLILLVISVILYFAWTKKWIHRRVLRRLFGGKYEGDAKQNYPKTQQPKQAQDTGQQCIKREHPYEDIEITPTSPFLSTPAANSKQNDTDLPESTNVTIDTSQLATSSAAGPEQQPAHISADNKIVKNRP